MTPERARERMSEAFEGELSEDERRAFEAALEHDAELAAEWETFREAMRRTRALGLEGAEPPTIELLGVVQRKLRARSRGRFYRDRFSTLTRAQMMLPIALGVLTIVLFAATLALRYYVEIAPR